MALSWRPHALTEGRGGDTRAGPHTVDVVYKTKPGMADAMKGAKEDDTASVGGWYIACSALKLGGLGAAAASYAQRSGYRAMTPKAVDINAARLGDIRTGSTKVPYNYVRPLGPGSYMGPDEKQKVMWAKKYGKGSTYDDSRPSSSFLSRPRPPLLARPAADLSDVLRRDRAHWTAKGCFTSKQVCMCERERERERDETDWLQPLQGEVRAR
jgi:hypothetical protein